MATYRRQMSITLVAWLTIASGSFEMRLLNGEEYHGDQALTKSVELAEEALDQLNEVRGCRMTMMFRERVGERLHPVSIAEVKVRQNPYCMHIKFKRPSNGRTVVYREDKNKPEVAIREAGWLGAMVPQIHLNPDSALIRSFSRRPIQQTGPWTMMRQLRNELHQSKNIAGLVATFRDDIQVRNRPCYYVCIQQPTAQRGRSPYYALVAYFHKDTKWCVRTERYGWPEENTSSPPLLEYYETLNYEPNVGLTDRDFEL